MPSAPLPTRSAIQYEPGSYRDRNGRVFYASGAVYRALSEQALHAWQTLRSKVFFGRCTGEGKLVSTEQVDPTDAPDAEVAREWAGILKHQAIPFVSYPYEWSFGMLQDAALLQLELLAAALDEDMTLKDGSAFNVQWMGAKPVFIDIPSFETLLPGEPWTGYRQFCQTCLYPLLLQAYKNVAFQPWLRGSIDGIDPEQFRNLMSVRDLLRRGVFTHVYLHAKLQRAWGQTSRNVKVELRSAGFSKALLKANTERLAGLVRDLSWKSAQSTWSDYAANNTYTETDRELKQRFVRNAVMTQPWKLVWDLGCNTGDYSRIAAENAKYVVAMDSDHLAVERLYQALKADGLSSILPLVSNVADTSPNLGWRGAERKALIDRGKPGLTLCLALIHHIVISANIPLKEFIDWLASLGTNLVIEFVTKEDPMVKTLLRNKQDNYSDYEQGLFERWLSEAFDIACRESLTSGTRTLYYARARL